MGPAIDSAAGDSDYEDKVVDQLRIEDIILSSNPHFSKLVFCYACI